MFNTSLYHHKETIALATEPIFERNEDSASDKYDNEYVHIEPHNLSAIHPNQKNT